jgi:hypothetical protein
MFINSIILVRFPVYHQGKSNEYDIKEAMEARDLAEDCSTREEWRLWAANRRQV